MEDLILYGTDGKKKKIIKNAISYECSVGRYSYSDNEFTLKTTFIKGDVFQIDEWVSYGLYTEFCGKIKAYEIDVYENTVTYKGLTLRGMVAHFATPTFTELSGSMATIFNNRVTNSFNTNLKNHLDASNDSRTTSITMNTATTNGLGFAHLLSLHDKIIKTASKSYNVEQKSRFWMFEGDIYIRFYDSDIHYYDSSKVKVKYVVNKLNANMTITSKMTDETTSPSMFYNLYLKSNGDTTIQNSDWMVGSSNALDEITAIVKSGADPDEYAVIIREGKDALLNAQENPSVSIELTTEEAEVDDVIVASIAELQMKVTRKVVEATIKISNGIPKITYELEG